MKISPITNQITSSLAQRNVLRDNLTVPTFTAVPKVNPEEITRAMQGGSKFFEPIKNFFKPLTDRINTAYNKAIDFGAEKVITPIVNSKLVNKFGEKTVKIDNMPCHLSTLGAAVTSSFYIKSTLKNEDLKKKERRTLAINQLLTFVVSTLGAYTINKSIDSFAKKIGYKFREINQGSKQLATRMKGFKTAQSLLIFAMMYRYVSPVLVTPIASALGKRINKNVNEQEG